MYLHAILVLQFKNLSILVLQLIYISFDLQAVFFNCLAISWK